MDEAPFYKLCSECVHYVYTDESTALPIHRKACTRYPTQTFPAPEYSCGEWLCKRCWTPWDMIEIANMDDPQPTIIDHSKCDVLSMNILPEDE